MVEAVRNSNPSRYPGLFVLGMHRSGTSATAGALARLGFRLGEKLIEAYDDNPKGYFEHADAVAANETLLDALDRSWDDPREMPADWGRAPSARALLPTIEAILADPSSHGRWALKDPRLCRTLPLWLEAAASAGVEARCLLILRHPAEVAASLRARDGMDAEVAALLWLRYVLESLRGSAACVRSLLTYEALMRDPYAALAAACGRLGFEIDADDVEVRSFVDPRDRHHRAQDDRANASPASPFMRLAVEIYRTAAEAGENAFDLDAAEARFGRAAADATLWIDALGRTLRAGDVRRRGLQARALAAQTRAEALQALFDDASALSLRRLTELEESDRRLRETQAALQAVEALSIQRMAEAQNLNAQLGATESAFVVAERLSLERQSELQALHAQLAETQNALTSAENLALERLTALERMGASRDELEIRISEASNELERLRAARADAEHRSHDRMAEIAALRATVSAQNDELAGLRARDADLRALERSAWFRLWRSIRRRFGLDRRAST
jgi:hypothetical protein